MKKITLLFFVFCFQIGFAQEYTVEKSTFNAQIGTFGIWVNNESRLGNQFTLRSEIGLDFFGRAGEDGINFHALAPGVTFEPRWYYNLEKRGKAGRNIQNNGGNFLGLMLRYNSDLFVISNLDIYVPNQISIIPKWGIKRNFGKSNFNYEASAGLGYNFVVDQDYYDKEGDVILDLNFRIGYTFKSSRVKQ